MSNKNIREQKELQNLFGDPKYYRQAWKAVGNAILLQPATKPIPELDKNGVETLDSQIEQYSYDKLSKDIKELAKEDRQPTELEMILHCQMVKARTDTQAAIFVRDTLGAKPVDETKVDAQINNPYEQLSDEELEMLAKMREEKAKQQLMQSPSLLDVDYVHKDTISTAVPEPIPTSYASTSLVEQDSDNSTVKESLDEIRP